MAKKHITQTIDDLDGSIIDDGTTLTFSLEGRSYEIDLSPRNADKLREAFQPYIAAGRSIGSPSGIPRRTPRGRAIPTRDLVDVRSWAQNNGFAINDRGRISGTILAAYDAAH
ncbi:histone-like nucleoid-structuring protein Lsr2 [Microbacterium testaceum]|uniref:histone-like nucleoid-structuring protein Lsr2 n=1 Tax=Microbacterium testaceum TaxID=2033 RepID=UPI001248A273|nr:Lsr2 family protein [Microbacterium testaceum]